MVVKFEAPRGMEDILPGEVTQWQWLEAKARNFFHSWGFREIRTPILESTGLFTRSIGETTDIVHKEMYSFKDRGDRELTMRPEMTASVARSVIENNLTRNQKSVELYYIGPMFRAERPQAGRKRQFHQIGAEIIHDGKEQADVNLDAKIIQGIYGLLDYLCLENIQLKINDLTLLNGEQKDEIREKLKKYFAKHKAKLDPDSLNRLDKNVLRIFDSKVPETKKIASAVPWDEIVPASDDFKTLMKHLKAQGIPVVEDRNLVRGLDYYTGVVFEVTSKGLGAQDAIAGGGRYNRLYKELGGPDVHCTGFSIGFERLIMALQKQEQTLDALVGRDSIYLAPIAQDEEVMRFVQTLGYNLGQRGFITHYQMGEHSLNKHLKKANKLGCRYVVIVGEEEFEKRVYKLKDMAEKKEKDYSGEKLLAHLCTVDYQNL